MPQELVIALAVALALLGGAGFILFGQFFSLWIQAALSGARVSPLEIAGMRWRGVDVRVIVLSRIRLLKSGIEVPTARLVDHHRAGGSVPACATALIVARQEGRELAWDPVAEADLAGLPVLELTAEALGRAPAAPDRAEIERQFVQAVAAAPGAPAAPASPAASASG